MNKIYNKIKKFVFDNKKSLIILFIISFLVYGYAGFNSIYNIDGIDDLFVGSEMSDYHNYLSVGRWGWALIGFIFDYYPSTFLCLIINSILFAFSGVLFVKTFDVKNKILGIIIAGIIVSFPVNFMIYFYTSQQFIIGLGYLCSIYSLYKIKNARSYKDYLISMLFICFSTSLYQMFIVIIVCGLIGIIINEYIECKNIKLFFKKLGYKIITVLLSLILYYIITKIVTMIFNISFSDYQDASLMFSINIKDMFCDIPRLLGRVFHPDFEGGFNVYVHYTLIIFLLISIISLFFRVKTYKYFILIILVILLIFSPRLLMIFKPKQIYHLLTLMPYSMLYGVLLSYLDNIKYKKIVNVFTVLLSIILINMIITANKYFVMSYNVMNSNFAYLNRLQMRIESTYGYNLLPKEKKYYIYRDEWDLSPHFPYSKAYSDNAAVKWSFLHMKGDIITAFNILGIDVLDASKYISSEEENEIINMLKDKNSYPSSEGIFIYKDIVVIKIESL